MLLLVRLFNYLCLLLCFYVLLCVYVCYYATIQGSRIKIIKVQSYFSFKSLLIKFLKLSSAKRYNKFKKTFMKHTFMKILIISDASFGVSDICIRYILKVTVKCRFNVKWLFWLMGLRNILHEVTVKLFRKTSLLTTSLNHGSENFCDRTSCFSNLNIKNVFYVCVE